MTLEYRTAVKDESVGPKSPEASEPEMSEEVAKRTSKNAARRRRKVILVLKSQVPMRRKY